MDNTILGYTIYHDLSGGHGHNWVAVTDISSDIAEEIAAEILDGRKTVDLDGWRAGDGEYYRW